MTCLVQQLLSEDLGYDPADITQIRNIVSAKLDVCSIFTDQKFYSQTITDRKILALFEDWFSNASYINGAYYGYRPKTSWDNAEFYRTLTRYHGNMTCPTKCRTGRLSRSLLKL